MIKKRLEWVDILKFLGIYAIYLGHYGNLASKFYLFVFGYHVPLFFFIAGFFVKYQKEESLGEFVKKKFKSIMVPYFIFSFIYLVVMLVTKNFEYNDILIRIKEIFLGIRETRAVANLWFLPCLFSMLVIYKITSIFFKNKKYLYLLFGVFTVIIAYYVFPILGISVPSAFLNIDSAIYYYFYFTLGMITFPIINKFNFKSSKTFNKVLVMSFCICTVAFTLLYYHVGNKEIINVINPYYNKLVGVLYEHLKTFILICFNIIISFGLYSLFKIKYLTKYNILPKIGQCTLYLCGIEFTWKILIWKVFIILGISFNLNSIHTLLLYNLIIIILATYIVVPIIKRVFKMIKIIK